MQFPSDTVQSRIRTDLGVVSLAAGTRGLVGLWFDGQRHLPAQLDGPGDEPLGEAVGATDVAVPVDADRVRAGAHRAGLAGHPAARGSLLAR